MQLQVQEEKSAVKDFSLASIHYEMHQQTLPTQP